MRKVIGYDKVKELLRAGNKLVVTPLGGSRFIDTGDTTYSVREDTLTKLIKNNELRGGFNSSNWCKVYTLKEVA